MIPIAHIGFTGVGSECATGQLLSSMLIEEGKFDLKVDISCLAAAESKSHVHMRSLFRAGTTELDISSVLAQISKFRIELLIVRLDPKFEIVGLEEIKKQLGCKIVVSIMDVVGYGDSIITPIKAADKLWFISESLACSYLDLAGDQDYFFSANGVSQDWRRSDTFVVRKIPLKIGFFGNLNQNQSLDAVFSLARAVDEINSSGLKYELHIYSRGSTNSDIVNSFSPLGDFIHLHDLVPIDEYRDTLQKHDLLFFGYGTSEEVIRYIEHSVSNKLPEVLCSGVPSVGYGSLRCESSRLYRKYRESYFVDGDSENAAEALISSLIDIEQNYIQHALEARKQAKGLSYEFDVRMIRLKFWQELSSLAGC